MDAGMTDLYETLGVGIDATPAAIRKAYRSMARKHHPDVGGDADTFHKIALAHDVLKDDARRAKYDATGEYEDGATQSPDQRAWDIVMQLFSQAIETESALHENMIDVMRQSLQIKIEGIQQNKLRAKEKLARIKKMQKRLKTKGNRNLFTALSQAEQGVNSIVTRMDAVMADMRRAIELLEDYEFEPEERQDPYANNTNAYGRSAESYFFNSLFGQNVR